MRGGREWGREGRREGGKTYKMADVRLVYSSISLHPSLPPSLPPSLRPSLFTPTGKGTRGLYGDTEGREEGGREGRWAGFLFAN